MLQHEQLFGRGTTYRSRSSASISQSRLSLKNFLSRRHTRQEVLRKYSGIDKKDFVRNTANRDRKVKGGRPVRGAFLQDKSPFLNFWSQVLIWDRPHASTPNVVTSFS
jgi:hypothetical protein